MIYINRRGQGYTETVDEFETRKEAREMIIEYRMADPSARFWMSQRCCRDWAEDIQEAQAEDLVSTEGEIDLDAQVKANHEYNKAQGLIL